MGNEGTAEQYLSRPLQEAAGSQKLRVSIPSRIGSEELFSWIVSTTGSIISTRYRGTFRVPDWTYSTSNKVMLELVL